MPPGDDAVQEKLEQGAQPLVVHSSSKREVWHLGGHCHPALTPASQWKVVVFGFCSSLDEATLFIGLL